MTDNTIVYGLISVHLLFFVVINFFIYKIYIISFVNNNKYLKTKHRFGRPGTIDRFGTKHWYLFGDLHRSDGPAIEWKNGNYSWFKFGKFHRENGPAVCVYDHQEWYLNGKLHRENGPARYNNYYDVSINEWFINGERHRINGPAIEYANGTKEWYQNGLKHREDGPAAEYIDGDKYWYYQDQAINCKSQKEFERLLKLLVFL